MAHIILVTSFKGGVGKSTVSANLALKLARLGQKVLLCDLDFDLGTLDLITGCEDRMLFDVCDAVYGRRDVEDCAVTFPMGSVISSALIAVQISRPVEGITRAVM